MGLGGVLGALVVIWAGANDEWATVRMPAVMIPGSQQPVEYEARVYALVAISFFTGVMASLGIALTIWVRSVRRERRLARALERLEAQVAETRGLHLHSSNQDLLEAKGSKRDPHYEDFDELEQDSIQGLLSDSIRLPEGYDDPEDEKIGEEDALELSDEKDKELDLG